MLNQKKSFIKTALPHLIAIVVFAIITMAYFMPLVQGKAMKQSDITQYNGAAQEVREYYQNEGESSAWTGSMFSGMPAYQIGIWGGSPNFLDYVEKPVRELAGGIAGPMFIGMLAAYILFIFMGFKPIVSIAGAIAYSFSSYNIVILDAGHISKAWAIAYMPLIIAGIMVMFKKRYLLGGILMALGLALQLKSNHMQMTYYTGILCALICVGLAVDFILKKDIKGLLKVSGSLAIAVALAIMANYSLIYNNYLMSEESIRGESELTKNKIDSETNKQTSGLDKDYVFQWSYGKAETFSLLVPNVHGGVSKPFPQDSEPYKALVKLVQSGQVPEASANQLFGYTTEYWGDQPFTSGPVYFGAIICFFFVLGMLVIRSKIKWILFVATIFFIFLSWGNNLAWLNDLFFYHFPIYNKFRAVSSALVIPALTMVIVSIWGLNEFLSGNVDKKKLTKSLYISLGITGGICLLLWIAPGTFFNFISERDEKLGLSDTGGFFQAVLAARKSMLSADALRSLVFILLTTAILWFALRSKIDKQKIGIGASVLIAVLMLIDLWGIDRRFLNDSNYESKAEQRKERFTQSTADKFILQDKHPSYRVLNPNNTFQEAMTSYYHKSIGGYSAAKLRRYQELIDHYLSNEVQYVGSICNQQLQATVTQMQSNGEQMDPNKIYQAMQTGVQQGFANTRILNMLNAKYIIFHPELGPILNEHAMGNAWFVPEYSFVNNADEEIAALENLNPIAHAIIDKQFEQEVGDLKITADSTATIELTTYKPNKLIYKSKANSEQLAVFSEIYFPQGWEVAIDGQKASHFRADWTLRAMRVPAGEHEIVFEFIPHGYLNARLIASIFSSVLILSVLGALGFIIFRRKKA